MDTLLSILTGNGLIAGIVAALVGAAVLYVKGRSDGAAKAANKSLKDKLASKEEQLEMHREANDAEREAAGLSDEAARKEALKWARR
ncbi:MAG TPA: hypothetical protein VNS02_09680 [Rhizobiaceae bacterium]|nr:hypothetical protein [Rhizobiaceae bacterium]